MTLSSPVLATALVPDSSSVWQKKFLASYDHPCISDSKEFAVAYQLRHFVMRRFIPCSGDQHHQYKVQLEMIKDLVLETYNRANRNRLYPAVSKNLAALALPEHNPWVYTFLSSALYGNRTARYGSSNKLHDSLQVLLSHLVLSPRSSLAKKITTARDNYDLTRVYLFNQPQCMLVSRQDSLTTQVVHRRSDSQRSLFRTPPAQYKIDMHTVLHIRNFWHRHMIDDTQATSENTYVSMMTELDKIGKTPQAWNAPLQRSTPLATRWYGHYSSLSPWPKSRKDLEERQSNAEDWETVDPRMLDLEVSKINTDEMYWPTVFSRIPIFADSIPDAEDVRRLNVQYFRGIAPFLDLHRHKGEFEGADNIRGNSKTLKWHPYKAARVHGIVYDLPTYQTADANCASLKRKRSREISSESDDLPGWKHIMMIMYMPTLQNLISVLEHAQENYGGSINAQLNTMLDASDSEDDEHENHETSTNDSSDESSDIAMHDTASDSDTDGPTEEQIQQGLQKLLDKRLAEYTTVHSKREAVARSLLDFNSKDNSEDAKNNTATTPTANVNDNSVNDGIAPLFSPSHIHSINNSYSPTSLLSFSNISYAYAYEGVLIPGSKIMFGRYWRIHGDAGLGPAREVGSDGVGVEVRAIPVTRIDRDHDDYDTADEDEKSSRKRKGKGKSQRKTKNPGETEFEFVSLINGIESRALNGCKGLDRGPFIFWTG